jgi:hypothetical protein
MRTARAASAEARKGSCSRRALQLHDGQLPSTSLEVDANGEPSTGFTRNQRLQLRARRTTWPCNLAVRCEAGG